MSRINNLQNNNFIEELKTKGILEKLLNMDDWEINREEILTWDDDGYEWRLRCKKYSKCSEYDVSCSNWRTIISENLTKAEKRRKISNKSCIIYLVKDYGTDGLIGDYYFENYVFTYINIFKIFKY
jgi:hypothetical protein